MIQNVNVTFRDDLESLASELSSRINVLHETIVDDDKLVILYGEEDVIALFANVYAQEPNRGQLRLRTKDKAAEWENVPIGFSKTHNYNQLIDAIQNNIAIDYNMNRIWYIDRQMKRMTGDRFVFTPLKSNDVKLYQVEFENGFVVRLAIEANEEYDNISCYQATRYILVDNQDNPIGGHMTADECVLMLVNISTQSDVRICDFINMAERCGGKARISHCYRLLDQSIDEAKAMFSNGYAIKFRIENGVLSVNLLVKINNQMATLGTNNLNNMNQVYELLEEFASLPPYDQIQKNDIK